MKKITLFLMLFVFAATFSQEKLDEVKIDIKQKGIKKSLTKTANTLSLIHI